MAPPLAPPSIFDPPYRAASDEAAIRFAGERLLDAARALLDQDIRCRTEVIFGDPATSICRRADELDADLIIVGSRGLNPLGRVFLGSVSAAVCQNAPCSVLVVREPGVPRA